jgi:small subunit ribosomal protein S1
MMVLKLKALRKFKSALVLPPKVGELVEGKVIATDRSAVFLDLGAKGIGIVYGAEFYRAKDLLKGLDIGDTVMAKVIELENEEGYRELSVVEASKEVTWEKLKDLKEKKEAIEVKIKKANKGGLMADIHGIQAFLPVSQLSAEHYPRFEDADPVKIAKALQKFIGETLKVRVIDLDPKKGKLIISEKAEGMKAEEEKKKESLKKYNVGDIVEGKITGVTNFGAFVGLEDNIEALLYASEISKGKKAKPEEVLKIGEKIKAKIIKIENDKIYLSLKV